MSEISEHLKIAAVVVTYNRLNLLKECIDSLRKQTRKINEIIIINNSSSDGTLEWLNNQKDLHIVTQENLGGAGGFHTGINTAYENGYDWIWCLDDDTIASNNALEELVKVICQFKNDSIGFLASKVTWTDGAPHTMNLPGYFYNKNIWNFIGDEKFKQGIHTIDVCSFVSCLFNRTSISKVGYPNGHFFIWFDDIEYTSRFLQYDNYYVSNSIVVHKTEKNTSVDLVHLNKLIDPKTCYGLRNMTYFYKKHNKMFVIKFIIYFVVVNIKALFINRTSIGVIFVSLLWIGKGFLRNLKVRSSSL